MLNKEDIVKLFDKAISENEDEMNEVIFPMAKEYLRGKVDAYRIAKMMIERHLEDNKS